MASVLPVVLNQVFKMFICFRKTIMLLNRRMEPNSPLTAHGQLGVSPHGQLGVSPRFEKKYAGSSPLLHLHLVRECVEQDRRSYSAGYTGDNAFRRFNHVINPFKKT